VETRNINISSIKENLLKCPGFESFFIKKIREVETWKKHFPLLLFRHRTLFNATKNNAKNPRPIPAEATFSNPGRLPSSDGQ
jgi:hypothetical protein